MIKVVIFDLGGVLLDWDPWAIYKSEFSSRSDFETFLVESRFYQCIDRSDNGEEWLALLKEMEVFAPHCVELATVYSQRFMESLTGVHEGTSQIVTELKNLSVPLYGLTNWSAESFPEVRKTFSFFDHFSDIIVSGVERIAKPDPKIFDLAASRWKIIPQETVFIDDREVNVLAAEQAGFNGIVYKNSDLLRKELCNIFPSLQKRTLRT